MTRSLKGKLITQHRENESRYYHVTLSKPGKKPKSYNVHTIVLINFMGPPPMGYVGCHGADGKSYNTVYNLRWDTVSENERDKYRW